MNIFKNKKFLIISGIVLGVLAIAAAVLFIINPFDKGEGSEPPPEQVKVSYLCQGTIKEEILLEFVDQDGNVLLKNQDVTNVYVSLDWSKDITYLEFALTDSAADIFYKALDEKKVISVRVDGTEIASPLEKDEITENSAIFIGSYLDEIMPCWRAVASPIFEG